MGRNIRVLGLAGSPRRRGNTDVLLDRLLAGAEEAGGRVDRVTISQLDLGGCLACQGCWDEGLCVVEDDFQGMNRKLVVSDVIALAAPLFFWNLPAQVKALIDRGQSQWARKFVVQEPLLPTASGRERRRGVFICVGGDTRRYFEGVVKTVRSFFQVYQTDLWATLLLDGVDAEGEIEKQPAALQEAYELGRRAVTESWDGAA